MMKKILSYYLVTLIALQSVAALADAHESHQSGTQHLSFEHEHEHEHMDETSAKHDSELYNDQFLPNNLIGQDKIVKNSVEIKKTLDKNPLFDCHHCCHCHGGGHSMWMVNSLFIFSSILYFDQNTPFQIFHVSGIQEKLLRPPIA